MYRGSDDHYIDYYRGPTLWSWRRATVFACAVSAALWAAIVAGIALLI